MGVGETLIGIPVYDGFDLLDVTGPWEMFHWAGYSMELVAAKPGLVACNSGLTVQVDKGFADAGDYNVLWTPGGASLNLNIQMADKAFCDFLVQKSVGADYVCSVCQGALLLAAAGLLDERTITTHWAFIPCFQQRFPKVSLADGFPRFHLDGKVLTGGGIAACLDEALELVRLISGDRAAQDVQQTTQYYPDPPVSSQIPQTSFCPLDAKDAQPPKP
jgi:transcriptional regulator GlxA family with amidase domain